MNFIDRHTLHEIVQNDVLIDRLRAAFSTNSVEVPLRHHHTFGSENTLLIMPAWQNEQYGGVKIVSIAPDNKNQNIASIQGIYYLFDSTTGVPICTIDAPTLTNLRTSCASALASSYLSPKNSSILLMVGTGSLAPYLIRAHATVRPISTVFIYGRSFDKAKALCQTLAQHSFECIPMRSIKEGVDKADIISCATLSSTPLINGEWVRKGQHIDLVGSFKPDMREADSELIKLSSLFVDTMEGATKESGDIVIPLNDGKIDKSHIKGDLFDLCSSRITGRTSEDEVTCFKSVGHALEDLAAAQLVHELINPSNIRS